MKDSSEPATRGDIQDVLDVIKDFMKQVDDRFNHLEGRFDTLEDRLDSNETDTSLLKKLILSK